VPLIEQAELLPFNSERSQELTGLLILILQNHPDVENKLVTCPFNASHRVLHAEIINHISSCDDKNCSEQHVGKPAAKIFQARD
jgi:hypothetical protein